MKKLILALCVVLMGASFAIADDFDLGIPTYPLPQATKIRVIINTITPTTINYTITWIDASNSEIITKFLALEGSDFDAVWNVVIPTAAVGKQLGTSLNTYIINRIKTKHGIQ